MPLFAEPSPTTSKNVASGSNSGTRFLTSSRLAISPSSKYLHKSSTVIVAFLVGSAYLFEVVIKLLASLSESLSLISSEFTSASIATDLVLSSTSVVLSALTLIKPFRLIQLQ